MMIRAKPRQQTGVALLQVLLLSIVMSLLLLQLVYTARGQLVLTRELEQRVQADLMIHSAKSEALFVRLVNPGSFDRSAVSLVPSTASTRTRNVSPIDDIEIDTALYDISGLLPLRYAKHPLWPRTLELLGMSGGDIERFMGELTDMQDADSEDSRFSDEPRFSSSGFSFPNAPIQTGNSLNAWFALEPGMRRRIAEISHHYTKTGVNLRASPEVIRDAALGGYGARLFDDSAGAEPAERQSALSRYLDDSFGPWVSLSASNLWRLDVEVRTEDLTRRAQYDFYVNPRDNIPVTLVGQ